MIKKTFALLVGTALLLQACGQQAEIKPIKIDGSSTVYPITEAVVKAYKANPPKKNGSNLEVQANFSGTGGGFRLTIGELLRKQAEFESRKVNN